MLKNILYSIKPIVFLFSLILTGTSLGQNIYLFSDPVYYNTGLSPVESVAKDVNGDGYFDLVVLNYNGSNVSVLLNNGNGTFQTQSLYPVTTLPRGIKVADFNNDSFPDIVTTSSNLNLISYLQNNGDGTFAASINSPTQQGPGRFDICDFNGDNYLDIALINSGSQAIQVLLNDHNGTFTSSFSASTGSGPQYIAVGDLDGDGNSEIVITRSYVNIYFNVGVLTVFKNNGDGTFTKYIDNTFAVSVGNIFIYDFNGDSYNDIITNALRNNSYSMCFFLNDGGGNFGDPITTFAGYQGTFTMGDFDLNGYMDFAVSEYQYNAGGLAIVLNDGYFNFEPVFSFYIGDQPRQPASGDFDSDGDIDIAVPLYNDAKVAVVINTLNPVPVELISFTVSVFENVVTLNWQTATEKDNSGFEIQRKSGSILPGGEQKGWVDIGFIEGQGTTTEPNSYTFTDKNLEAGFYLYKLVQIDFDGTNTESEIVNVEVSSQPIEYFLSQNYPNPFNPSTTIEYSIPESGNVKLTVYNSLGEEVTTLVNDYKESGSYKINFDASSVANGIYLYKLEATPLGGQTGNFTSIKKMIVLK